MVGKRRDDAYNWQVRPSLAPEDASELSKRILQADTKLGVIASVHLVKVNTSTGLNARLARSDGWMPWLFDCHDVVMGDCNAEWAFMIGAEDPTKSMHSAAAKNKVAAIRAGAWVSSTTHGCEHRPSYLPGGVDGLKAVAPPPIDLVVVTRPLTVKLLPKQPGVKFTSCKQPRSLMKSLGWPSDHTSVVATVSDGASSLTVATWNCADPHYFGKFFPSAAKGFDWQSEPERFDQIEKHARVLLQTADVVGVQEVPCGLVARLVTLGAKLGFEVQWVAAPSLEDKAVYSDVVGRSGRSTSPIEPRTLSELPAVAHDLLFCKYASLKAAPELEGSLAAALTNVEGGAAVASASSSSAAAVAESQSGQENEQGDVHAALGLAPAAAPPAAASPPAEEAVDVADSWEDL